MHRLPGISRTICWTEWANKFNIVYILYVCVVYYTCVRLCAFWFIWFVLLLRGYFISWTCVYSIELPRYSKLSIIRLLFLSLVWFFDNYDVVLSTNMLVLIHGKMQKLKKKRRRWKVKKSLSDKKTLTHAYNSDAIKNVQMGFKWNEKCGVEW